MSHDRERTINAPACDSTYLSTHAHVASHHLTRLRATLIAANQLIGMTQKEAVQHVNDLLQLVEEAVDALTFIAPTADQPVHSERSDA